MPVHRLTTRGDVLLGHFLAQQPLPRLLAHFAEMLFQFGQALFGRLDLLLRLEAPA